VFEKKRPLGEFHASLREVEEGLYLAQYSGEMASSSGQSHLALSGAGSVAD
jgi:hypothetical protein